MKEESLVEISEKIYLSVSVKAIETSSSKFARLGIIIFASFGCSSKNASNTLDTAESTIPLTSLLPNFVLVCPSNCGSGTFI